MGPPISEVKDVNNSARRSAEFDFSSNGNQILFMAESNNALVAMAGAAPVSEAPRLPSVSTERAAEHVERFDVKVVANANRGGITTIQCCSNVTIANVHAHDSVSQTPIGCRLTGVDSA